MICILWYRLLFFCVSLGLLYYTVMVFFSQLLDFLDTSQETGWEEHLRCDLFNVNWDIKPNLINQPISTAWRHIEVHVCKQLA